MHNPLRWPSVVTTQLDRSGGEAVSPQPPHRLSIVTSETLQVQNPLLQFALEDAAYVEFRCGSKVVRRQRDAEVKVAENTHREMPDLSGKPFGIVAFAEHTLATSKPSLFHRVFASILGASRREYTSVSLTLVPPDAAAEIAYLRLIVPVQGDYPTYLREMLKSNSGVRSALASLVGHCATSDPVTAEIAEQLREQFFTPILRSSAMLPSSITWSGIAPSIRPRAFDALFAFEVSSLEGYQRMCTTVERASRAVRSAA